MALDEQEAFTELYNRHWKKLFTIANNRLKDSAAAEDIVHDIFTRLWAVRHSLQIESPENYLATAVKFAVLGKIKKQLHQQAYQQHAASAPVITMPVEAAVQHKQIMELINKQVEKLPPQCRLIFKYSREAGMPVKQIAQQLQLSPKTVENQLTKALRYLRPVLRSFMHLLTFLFFF